MDKVRTIVIKNGKRILVPLVEPIPEPIIPNKAEKQFLNMLDKMLKRYHRQKAVGKFIKIKKTKDKIIEPVKPTREEVLSDLGITPDDLKKNTKLPWTKSEIISDYHFIHLSIQKGFRIKIDPKRRFRLGECLIDGIKYQFGHDTTMLMCGADGLMHHYKKIDINLGDGIYVPKKFQSRHIGSPWSYMLWLVKFPTEVPLLKDKTHWMCLMFRANYYRNQIARQFIEDTSLFELSNYFIYHRCPAKYRPYLDKRMFKKREPYVVSLESPGNTNFKSDEGVVRQENFLSTKGQSLNLTHLPHKHLIFDYTEEYKQSMIDFVQETSSEFFYVTEKTAKPLAFGIPFVAIGCHQYLHKLRKMGFKTFHPYIDESYDNEQNLKIRIKMAFKSFNDFMKMKDKPFDELQIICDHNRKIIQHIQQNYNYMDKVWQKLSSKIKGLPKVDL